MEINKDNKRIYGFGLKHYWNYFKINFIISSKENTEYKTNLISTFILSFFGTITTLFFGYIAIDKFGNDIGWNFLDYVVFTYLVNLFLDLSGIFSYGKDLKYFIIQGKLNSIFIGQEIIF